MEVGNLGDWWLRVVDDTWGEGLELPGIWVLGSQNSFGVKGLLLFTLYWEGRH